MLNYPLSDLSLSTVLQRNGSAVRANLQQAGVEMSTGLKSDLIAATNGNLDQIFSIDRALGHLKQQSVDLAKAQSRAEATQLNLGTIQDVASPFGTDLLASVSRSDFTSARIFAKNAEAELTSVVRALNGEFAGRRLFSGAADGQIAIAGTDVLLAQVSSILTAAPDATTALTEIDAFFDDVGGGFETLIYSGATEDAASVMTPEGERIDYMVRADAQPIREVLKGMAITAAFDQGMFGGDLDEMKTLLSSAGQDMVSGADGVVLMRADIGAAEAGIADGQAYAAAQKNSLDLARTSLAGVDVFDAAARFAALETQLTATYTVTSRLSSLTLTNFLR